MQNTPATEQTPLLSPLSVDERISQENHAIYLTSHPDGMQHTSRRAIIIVSVCTIVLLFGSVGFALQRRHSESATTTSSTKLSSIDDGSVASATNNNEGSQSKPALTDTEAQSSDAHPSSTGNPQSPQPSSSVGSSSPSSGSLQPIPRQATSPTPTNPQPTPTPTTPTPTTATPIDPSINVATYNIRATDLTKWDSTRANAILGYIKTVDIAGLQEGRSDSIPWLTTRLSSVGYRRTVNQWARNSFWKTNLFTFIKEGEKQLDSEKDLVWVKLRHTSSGKVFYFADVHLDVSSSTNRTAELKTALAYMATYMKDAPIIFVGDMNSERNSSQDKQIRAAGFQNSYDVASTKIHITYKTTLSGFTGGTTGTITTNSSRQIDHVYIKGNLAVSRIEIVAQKGSDHLPVEVDIVLK
jgi:endonuclease/exonuclease/phosphatase family metal-dependent hydrolase